MKINILYVSVVLNLVLLASLALHWRYISMKYTWRYPAPLACDVLRLSYQQRYEHEFKKGDAYFAVNPEGQNMTDEIRSVLKKIDAVQEKAQQIEQICKQAVE